MLQSIIVTIGIFLASILGIHQPTNKSTVQIATTTPEEIALNVQSKGTALVRNAWQRPPIAPPQGEDAPCLTSYVIYNGTVFYGAVPVIQADLSTFYALPTSNCVSYGKDRNHVYIGYIGNWGLHKIIPNADPISFLPFFDASGLILYSKDHSHVYRAEPLAYELPTSDGGIDEMANVDPNTFSVLYDKDGYFTGYAKDDRNVYYYSIPYPIPDADQTSFVVLDGIWNWSQSDAHTIIGAGYGKDKVSVYYGFNKIEGVEISSFASENTPSGLWTPYMKDNNRVYCEDYKHSYKTITLLRQASSTTFVPETTQTAGLAATPTINTTGGITALRSISSGLLIEFETRLP